MERSAAYLATCVFAAIAILSGAGCSRSYDPREDGTYLKQKQAADERAALVLKWGTLYEQVRDQWRSDIEAAGATGGPNVWPPMLDGYESDAGYVATNLTDRELCVLVRRVVAPNRDHGYPLICVLRGNDENRACYKMRPRAQRAFVPPEGEENVACERGKLEFRIGSEMDPEHSWWSRSALEEFDISSKAIRGRYTRPRSPAEPEDYLMQRYPTQQLAEEVTLYESLLADQGRAERWRAELAEFARVKAELAASDAPVPVSLDH